MVRVHAQSLALAGMQIADLEVSLGDIASWRWGTAAQGGQPDPDSQGDWPEGGTELSASQGQQLFLAGKEEE